MKFNPQTEEWFVTKVKDELTKNHRELENIVSGIMPENKTDILCPVDSFRKYKEHLNPNCDFLWQYPLEKIDQTRPNVWYSKRNIGKNTLGGFMQDISKKCDLSQIYTNHSIRVTGCTVLTRCNFSNSEIMSVSGHKSIQSLAIYQKTKDTQKIQMAKALFKSMTKNEEQCIPLQHAERMALPAPPPVITEHAVALKPNTT